MHFGSNDLAVAQQVSSNLSNSPECLHLGQAKHEVAHGYKRHLCSMGAL